MRYGNLVAAFNDTVWAITPGKYEELRALLDLKAEGAIFATEEIERRLEAAGARPAPSARMANNIAVLPLFGTILPRANLMTETSGGTSAERWGAQFQAALADPSVAGIIVDIDSPGGSSSGIPELFSTILRARGQKPVWSVANHMAASAAYWLATATDRIYVSPSAEIGSIGVFGRHLDQSKALEREGIKVTLISAGKRKVDGNPYEPLSESGRESFQAKVNDVYGMFTRDVAKGRGVSAEAVRAGFGEGDTVGARQAVAEGMADVVGTLDDAIRGMARALRGASGGHSAAWLPADEIRALEDMSPVTHNHYNLTIDGPADGVWTINGKPITAADLAEAQAAKAAEHDDSSEWVSSLGKDAIEFHAKALGIPPDKLAAALSAAEHTEDEAAAVAPDDREPVAVGPKDSGVPASLHRTRLRLLHGG